ncbi:MULTISPECIES: hypothetical protein [unclassified Pseudactinotalea]|uniref:hypothetical protein n=1 Tax=Micrococcales TaxID=85006 RepID=UPI003C7E0D35
MTSEGTSRPKPEADQDNVPGSQHGDTPQDEQQPTHSGGPGADPELPDEERER